jgi:hypothetical protein
MAMVTNTLGPFGSLGALGLASLLALPCCAGPRFGPWQRESSFARASTQTLAIVRVQTPWYAPNFVVRSRLRGAVPEHEAIAVIDGRARVVGEPLGARSISFPAFATVSLWSLSSRAQRGAMSEPAVDFEGMIRAFEVASDGRVGLVAVFATRAHAEAALAH